MPQRRNPFSYGGGGNEASAGSRNQVAAPMTGTGTDSTSTYATDFDDPNAQMAEEAATTRRRIMPVVGNIPAQPDMLQSAQALLAQRQRQRGGMR